MALILSVVEVASTWPWYFAGHSARSAHGEVGQRILTTLALFSNTFSPGPIHLSSSERTTSIPIELGVTHAQLVVALALVHECSTNTNMTEHENSQIA
jgi:hypothetical protein